jgi:hypothetical protein
MTVVRDLRAPARARRDAEEKRIDALPGQRRVRLVNAGQSFGQAGSTCSQVGTPPVSSVNMSSTKGLRLMPSPRV